MGEYPEGGECFCASTLSLATRHGMSADCNDDGRGGAWALDIYQINYAANTNEYEEGDNNNGGESNEKKIFGMDEEIGIAVMCGILVVCLMCCVVGIYLVKKQKKSAD